MNDEEIGTALYEACQEWDRRTDRALQDKEFRIGISSLGFCSEQVRRQLNREEEQPTDLWKAFVGTWVANGIEAAAPLAFPDAITQADVTLVLQGEYGEYQIPGHPDIIVPSLGLLLDNKGVNGFEDVRKHGMENQQKRFQRHGYGYAAWEAGFFGDLALEDVRVGNCWHDRSATETEFFVATEPLDLAVIKEMTDWLDDVVYHWQNQQEAQKQPPRNVCEKFCGFYSVCRETDTDVEGLITHPDLLRAVELHEEGRELKRRGTSMQDEAKEMLDNVRGSTGTFTVRWTDVPGSEIQPGFRRGYRRLDIKRLSK